MADRPARLKGSSILAAVKASGVEYVLAVPDIVTSQALLVPIAADPRLTLIRVCKEDECIGIAAGLWYGDKKAVILIQHTGMLDSINALRAVAVEQQQPICMMVGLLGRDPDRPLRESRRYGLRIVEPILAAMGIAYHLIESEADVPRIGPAIERCYARSEPVALLIGERPC